MALPKTMLLQPGECVRVTLSDGRTVVGRMAHAWLSSGAALLSIHVDHGVMGFDMDADKKGGATVERVTEAELAESGCCGGDRRRYESDGSGGYMPVAEPAEPPEPEEESGDDTGTPE